jgi:hypothetical protein
MYMTYRTGDVSMACRSQCLLPIVLDLVGVNGQHDIISPTISDIYRKVPCPYYAEGSAPAMAGWVELNMARMLVVLGPLQEVMV